MIIWDGSVSGPRTLFLIKQAISFKFRIINFFFLILSMIKAWKECQALSPFWLILYLMFKFILAQFACIYKMQTNIKEG